jgi:uncharacterized protein involved in exopolysaccharide biosynthesis
MQIQQLLQAINQNQERRLLVERALTDLEAEQAAPAAVSAPLAPEGPNAGTAAQQLAIARAQLTAMLMRLKPEHPDVGRVRRVIAELEEKAEAEALRVPLSGADSGLSAAEVKRQTRIAELRAGLEQITRHIAAQQQEEQRLRAMTQAYQQRVEATPTRESEMVELTRDYGMLQKMYSELLTKREDAKLSANLERRQIGEQFEILDPARLPERPFSPDRRGMNAIGMAVGLALGVGLVALLEYRDRSFKFEEEIKSVLALPVLATVPLMRSDAEQRRVRRRSALVSVVLGTAVLGCLAVVTYTFVR